MQGGLSDFVECGERRAESRFPAHGWGGGSLGALLDGVIASPPRAGGEVLVLVVLKEVVLKEVVLKWEILLRWCLECSGSPSTCSGLD